MMYIGVYQDTDGNKHGGLYYSREHLKAEFTPLSTPCTYDESTVIIPLCASGKTYKERKKDIESKAIEWSNNNDFDLYMSEYADISGFFETAGKRYGLLAEFRENAIC